MSFIAPIYNSLSQAQKNEVREMLLQQSNGKLLPNVLKQLNKEKIHSKNLKKQLNNLLKLQSKTDANKLLTSAQNIVLSPNNNDVLHNALNTHSFVNDLSDLQNDIDNAGKINKNVVNLLKFDLYILLLFQRSPQLFVPLLSSFIEVSLKKLKSIRPSKFLSLIYKFLSTLSFLSIKIAWFGISRLPSLLRLAILVCKSLYSVINSESIFSEY
jgi:hypothetical protein